MNLKEIKKLVTISDGNSKMGVVPSISLPPIVTCNKKAPCTKGGCYALNGAFQYPSVQGAYAKNLNTFKSSPKDYFNAIDAWLHIRKPSIFRFHVSGDIPNKRYLTEMMKIAAYNPEIKFLAFTKKYALLKGISVPKNLSIVASAWTGFDMPAHDYPIAWLNDGIEDRIPKDAIECHGNCETCGMCWSLKKLGKDVYFNKH